MRPWRWLLWDGETGFEVSCGLRQVCLGRLLLLRLCFAESRQSQKSRKMETPLAWWSEQQDMGTQDITSSGVGLVWRGENRAGHNCLQPRLSQPVQNMAWVQRETEEHIWGWASIEHSVYNLLYLHFRWDNIIIVIYWLLQVHCLLLKVRLDWSFI